MAISKPGRAATDKISGRIWAHRVGVEMESQQPSPAEEHYRLGMSLLDQGRGADAFERPPFFIPNSSEWG